MSGEEAEEVGGGLALGFGAFACGGDVVEAVEGAGAGVEEEEFFTREEGLLDLGEDLLGFGGVKPAEELVELEVMALQDLEEAQV